MEEQKVDMYLMSYARYFDPSDMPMLRDRLLMAQQQKWPMLSSLDFKDPTLVLIISLLFGALGIDRFMIGDTGLGIGKLITLGGCGVWTVVDWFLIQQACRRKNLTKLQMYLG